MNNKQHNVTILTGKKSHAFLPILFLTAFSLIFQHCTERIEVDLDSSYKRLIVDGNLTTEYKVHQVRLTVTADYFSNEPATVVSGARVFIQSQLDTIQLNETPSNPGIYKTPGLYGATPGIAYTLFIDDVDINQDGITEQYTATDQAPAPPVIDSIALLPEEFFGSEFLDLVIFANDPANIENQYMFKLIINDTLISDTIDEVIYTEDDFYDGNYIAGLTVFFLDQTDDGGDEVLHLGDTVTLEMAGISSKYFTYLIEYNTVLQGTNPFFGGPPANANSNVSGNALGFFAVYSSTEYSRVYEKDLFNLKNQRQ